MPPSRARASPARSRTPKRASAKATAAAEAAPPQSASGAELHAWQTGANAKQKVGPEYEFGGPVGAVGVIVGLPIVIYVLYFGCGKSFCVDSIDSAAELPAQLSAALSTTKLWSWTACAVVFGWTVLHFIAYLVLPGPMAPGVVLRDGKRLRYPMNAHLAFWLCLVGAYALPHVVKGASLAWLYDHYVELTSASMALSLGISFLSYAMSFRRGELLAEGGQTGVRTAARERPSVCARAKRVRDAKRVQAPSVCPRAPIPAGRVSPRARAQNVLYDFFIGRPLNPRLGLLDLKVACELRPGLIGWAILDLGMAAKQYALLGYVSGPMLCVCVFQTIYVWDALYYEQAILTTMDVTTDGFGFMLAFGDLSWVPFTYSLQARILVDHDPQLSTLALVAITALKALGYFIFRGANSQKDAFRRDPNDESVAHLQYMQTKRGTRLLTSGFWGMAVRACVRACVRARRVARPRVQGRQGLRMGRTEGMGGSGRRGGGGATCMCMPCRLRRRASGSHLRARDAQRKINYTGDWLMGLSWCLCCGLTTPVAYFYSTYFLVLLIHRAVRDDHFCALKYGDDWKAYKARVPAVFIPNII